MAAHCRFYSTVKRRWPKDPLLADNCRFVVDRELASTGFAAGGEDDYIMSLKTPAQVKVVADALARLTRDEFRERYQAIAPEDYGFDLTDADFEYTWKWLQEVVRLYQTAADESRYMLFTADQ